MELLLTALLPQQLSQHLKVLLVLREESSRSALTRFLQFLCPNCVGDFSSRILPSGLGKQSKVMVTAYIAGESLEPSQQLKERCSMPVR